MNTKLGKLWGDQYPFERGHLQRAMTLVGLGCVFAFSVVVLVHAEVFGVFGISLMCAGVVSALAALSRHRYVRETRLGYVVLGTRGGLFVLGSALAFAVVGALVVLLIVLD